MVYKIVWSLKALESYLSTMKYLEEFWTVKEVKNFASLVEKKLNLLSKEPRMGLAKSKREVNLRKTVIHKRVLLIYKINSRKKEVELLLFWNTYQNPSQLRIK